MQIKTTIRYHLTPGTMSFINKNQKTTNVGGEIGTLAHCFWECKMVQLLWETVWRVLKKFKTELSYDPEIPLLGIYPKDFSQHL